ncbi:hypothetical protein [Algoriphagus terrigena]|uniref:hypothetical protein n=1 Tax=Algoriphagus terrigena TaxID=344884 RepID=UPI0003F77235|nr:hypothetical protein [Algoriphagus terrigena]
MKNFQTVCAGFPIASLSGKFGTWLDVLVKNGMENNLRVCFQIGPGSADRLFPLKPKNPI